LAYNHHIAVLFRRIGPYHFARLKAAGERLHVTAVEFSNVDPTYNWSEVKGRDHFKRLTLFSGVSVESQPANRIFARMSQALDELRPAAVAIPGWSERCSRAALRWCVLHAVPAIVMSETTAWDGTRVWWREWAKRRIVRLCASALVGGQAHADYIASLGMARERISLGYDAVDNEYFARGAEEVGKQETEVRARYELPQRYFLASARFVEKKNLLRLLQAYARYRQLASAPRLHRFGAASLRFPAWSLLLLGDGPLRPTLNSQLATLNLHGQVLLPGFKQYPDLPAYYGLASAFVHASTTEPWGLVVNEAMASGLPVLVSNRCGCAPDLVRDGANGFTFDPCNVEQLARLMLKVSTLNYQLSTFGVASRRIVASWGADRFASGLHRAVGAGTASSPLLNLQGISRGRGRPRSV
jgi:glycosyltransferase involved in cell wall biosynthesis